MVTPAEFFLNGNEALLRQNGKEFKVTILEPSDARFEELSTKPSRPEENQNEGTTMLATSVYKDDLLPFKINVELNPYDTLLSEHVSVEWSSSSLSKPRILANYPNPFRDITMLMFDLPDDQAVSLNIYNLKGQHVLHVLSEKRPAGRNVVHFRAESLDPGVYVLKLTHSGGTESMRIVKQ